MKTIAVSSGKGGTGKSCVTAYTGAALAKLGHRVLLLEMGASSRSLDLILGVNSDILFDFSDVVAGRCTADRAIVTTAYHNALDVLLGPPLSSVFMPDISWFRKLLDFLEDSYDYIFLDGVSFHSLPPALVDLVLLIVTPDSLAIRSTAMHARALYEAEVNDVRLLFNKVASDPLPMYGARDFDDILDTIGAQLLGVIPKSPILQYCSNNAQPLDSSILPAAVFDNIAKRLLGEHPTLLIK